MRANFRIHVVETQHSVRSITSVLRSKNRGQAEMIVAFFGFVSSDTDLEVSMTDKELRRLSRSELLEMMISLTEENEKLKLRLEQVEAQFQDRRIMIDKAGSIAEAALQLNNVFEAADRAAQQYLENVRRMVEEDSAL